MRPRWAAAGVVLVLSLSGCSEVSQTLDTAGDALDKAAACTEAIGIVTSFDLESLSPEQIQDKAAKKAQQLRELGNKVSDASVQEALFAVADSYVALQQRQADALRDVNQWIQNNIDKIETLKKVCL